MQTGIFLSAFMLMAGSIIGIGPQNTLLLKQGLAKFHVGRIVAFCVVFDALLIALGVYWVGATLQQMPALNRLLVAVAAVLMCWLALSSFRSAWQNRYAFVDGEAVACGRKIRRQMLIVTVFNPLVWLDTVVLMGGLAATHTAEGRLWVTLGGLSASLLWFAGVGFGARALAPVFRDARSWRRLDLVIGCVMVFLAVNLAKRLFT